ncbi:MAG: DUF1552 domain-containing protein [Myxococcales bacterium]|nr:DUF1552 domain-containing protein [Myxococcales bacterium]
MLSPSRRDLLRAAGVGAAVATFSRRLAHAAAPAPMRLVIYWTANGANQKKFWPSAGTTSSMILEPLGELKNDITVVKNVTFAGTGDHKTGMPFSMTGYTTNPPTSISIDQAAAKATGKPALVLGGQAKEQNYRGWFSFDTSGSPVMPTANPTTAFTQVFGTPKPGGGTGTPPPPPAGGYDAALQKKIFEAALGDAQALKAKLPSAEVVKMDQQIEALDGLAKALDGLDNGGNTGTPTQPSAVECKDLDSSGWVETNEDYRTRIKLHLDLITASFACDARRVASLMLSPGGHDSMGGHLGFLGVGGDIHNSIAHKIYDDPANHDKMANIKRWEVEQFAYLLKSLKATKDVDGKTLLDNTVVLFTSECTDGNHGHTNIPVMVAGGGGRLNLGKVLDAGGSSKNYVQLLLGLARTAGANLPKFGDATESWTPLVG